MPDIIILILIVIIVLYLIYNRNETFSVCNDSILNYFNNKYSANRYYDIVKEFGNPTTKIDEPYGLVIWRGVGIFERLTLKDESVEHEYPSQHCDFLYGTIRIHIPYEDINKVMELSKYTYIVYDRFKKELTVRCHMSRTITAILLLAMYIIKDPNSYNNIIDQYVNTVNSSIDEYQYKKMYELLEKYVRENQILYKRELDVRTCEFTQGSS